MKNQLLMGSRFVASGLTPSNIVIIASSWFPLPSQAFFLDTIEEAYNMNPPLIFYPKKYGFRPIVLSKKIFGWVDTGT